MNFLEEYLVKLGIQIDNKEFKKAAEVVGNLANDLEKKLPASVSTAVKGMGAVATAVISVTAETVKMVNQVAKADMQYQLLAQRMFLSVQAAKAFTLSSETLGANLHEIAWNVELRERYFDLVDQVNKLQIPPEARDMLKQVRSIGHEFDRLKLAGKLSLEWIAVHLLGLNKGGLEEMRTKLRSFTENIFDKIPIWTKQIATFLDIPIKLAKTVIKLFGDIKDAAMPVLRLLWGFLEKIWNMMAPWQRQLIVLGALIIAVFSPIVGPIAAATAAVTAFLFVLDDLYAYLEGRKSSDLLKPFWKFYEFLDFTLKKTLIGITIVASHMWDALFRRKHPSGLDVWEDLDRQLNKFDEAWFKWKLKMDTKRAAAEAGVGAPAGAVVEAGKGYTVIQNVEGTLLQRTGSRSWRNNNPGNLKYGDFARRMGAIGSDDKGFAVFSDLETGRRAQEALLFEAYRNKSLTAAISAYAPSNENDTRRYQRHVLSAVRGRNKLMSQYTPEERQNIMQAVRGMEGFRVGTTSIVGRPNVPQAPPGVPAPSVGTRQTISNNFNFGGITVNSTSADPRRVAKEVTEELTRTLSAQQRRKVIVGSQWD